MIDHNCVVDCSCDYYRNVIRTTCIGMIDHSDITMVLTCAMMTSYYTGSIWSFNFGLVNNILLSNVSSLFRLLRVIWQIFSVDLEG